MSSTPDRPGGSEDPFAVAEALQSVVRDTAAIEREAPAERITEAIGADDGRRDTVVLDEEMLGRRETVRVPTQRRPTPGRRAPLPVAALFATLWAALLTYLPVAAVIGLARTLEGSGGLAGAAHAGLAGWMLGHGVPIGTSIGPLALAPLALTGFVLWRLNRAGLHVTRAIGARRTGSIPRAILVAVVVGCAYALVGALASILVDGRGTEVSTGVAASRFLALGVLGSLVGALRGTDAISVLARRAPPAIRHGLRSGVVAAFLILAAGAVAGGLAVALGGAQAADIIAGYQTGVAGQAGITLISIGYAVNVSIWAAAYLLGPGFALGTGTIVRLTEVAVGPPPMLPLVAGLPEGPVGAIGTLLLACPVIAGAVAGWALTQRLRFGRDSAWRAARRAGKGSAAVVEPRWSLLVTSGLFAGPVAGVALGVLAWLSGGAVGSGRLARIGPDPVQTGVVAALVVAVSVTLGATATRAFFRRS
ncbi:hypothetical protein FHR83_005199 [Actinoplanes campanulatus]|uniref:Uncharacterized protein n=1 Tax=Actinoplanes campanulatus TaxID=113559 RepID=A0A7W5AK14_9ACTN|nr:DUF6350 family protein [Actinoplanes campanulatus]MBB3097521.1 hypothetical protein [Actinoplanes campanulatus]GGN27386.1 hypothetical protein GCM10010109_44910 [Actinoplanes campanulatus]GID38016.1 hypothetical protein Aca09nite_45220 [Actinoplanes campanulatus]